MSYTENDILLHVGPRALEAGRILHAMTARNK
jgi:hypothetical protein